MSGKLVIRRDDGTVETVAVTGPIRIGSAPKSDVRIEGEGVLPLHANAGFEGGEYWIRDAGNAGVAINGERAVEKRTLRHLDVITVGSSVNVIFSTTAAPLPAQPRSKRPLPPAVAAPTPPPPPKMTEVVKPVVAPSPNTILGPAPGVMPAFQSADVGADSVNTILGPAAPGVTPKFQPFADSDSPNTIQGPAMPGITPKFQPADSEPGLSPNTIVEPASRGVPPKFDPVGQNTAAAIPNTIVEPPNRGAAPKFEASPSLMEPVPQPAVASPRPTVARARPPAAERPITGVTLRGNSGVLKAPLGRSVIGRSATATIRIDSQEVSKVHAFLDVTATEVTLTDQKSVNGTTVNGSPATGPRRLIEGDRIAFATFEFRVEFVRMDGSE
jgi:pSer/pThr/pTyr-binding forkhead associated (FHA) protein